MNYEFLNLGNGVFLVETPFLDAFGDHEELLAQARKEGGRFLCYFESYARDPAGLFIVRALGEECTPNRPLMTDEDFEKLYPDRLGSLPKWFDEENFRCADARIYPTARQYGKVPLVGDLCVMDSFRLLKVYFLLLRPDAIVASLEALGAARIPDEETIGRWLNAVRLDPQ